MFLFLPFIFSSSTNSENRRMEPVLPGEIAGSTGGMGEVEGKGVGG
jgi:hypothetical protein